MTHSLAWIIIAFLTFILGLILGSANSEVEITSENCDCETGVKSIVSLSEIYAKNSADEVSVLNQKFLALQQHLGVSIYKNDGYRVVDHKNQSGGTSTPGGGNSAISLKRK